MKIRGTGKTKRTRKWNKIGRDPISQMIIELFFCKPTSLATHPTGSFSSQFWKGAESKCSDPQPNISQDHLPRGGMAHNWLTPPTSAINQENVPTGMPREQSDGGNFSIEVPFPR